MTWTISLNKDAKVSYGGVTVTDKITSDSQKYMYYDTDTPLTVTVKDASGNTVRTDSVNWSELSGDKKTTWSYTIPESDSEAYSYTISYDTLINVEGQETSFTVKNDVEDTAGDKDSGSKGIPVDTSKYFNVKKSVQKVTSNEATWKLVINVPESGFSALNVTDYLPYTWVNNEQVYDTYVDGSLSVDGLLDGESYSLDTTSQTGQILIDFYKDADKTETGLNKSSSSREITLTYKSKANEKWLAAAKENAGYEGHKNRVSVKANGSTTKESEATANFASLSLTKYANGSYTTNDGLPAYRYQIYVKGTKNLSDDEKAKFKITDTFNTEYLKYLDNSAWAANSQKGVTATATDKGVEFTFSDDVLNKESFTLTYDLVVKDKAALKALQEAAAKADDHKVTLTNNAEALGVKTNATVTYDYTNPLDKTITDWPSEYNHYTVKYKITVNENAASLNNGEALTITDTMSNLRMNGKPTLYVNGVEQSSFKYSTSGDTVTFTVPDAAKIEIVYSAEIIGSGTVTYSNTAKVNGYESKKVEYSANVHYTSGGTGSTPAITVEKSDADTAEALEGAKFSLWIQDKDSGEYTRVTKTDGSELLFTTDENGSFKLQKNQGYNFIMARTYKLVEESAPKGYVKSTEPIVFQIVSNNETLDESYQYHTGSYIEYKNTKKEVNTISIPVSKVWASGTAGTDSITVQLLKNGEVVEGQTLTLNADNDWKGQFDNLPEEDDEGNPITYSVQEVKVDGYTSTITGDQDKGFTITNTEDTKEVTISKQDVGGTEIEGAELEVTDSEGNSVEKWTSEAGKSHSIKVQPGTYTLTETTAPAGYKKAESIEFTVDKDGKVTVGGKEVDKVTMVDAEKSQVEISKVDATTKNELPGAELTIKDSEGKVVETWTSTSETHKVKLEAGKYTLTEVTAPQGYEIAESIEFEIDEEGNVVGSEDNKVTMTDEYSDQTVEISKTDVGGTEIEGAQLKVTDKDNNEVASWTSEAGKSHSIKVQPGTYTLTETTAPAGYKKAESIEFTVDKDGKVTVGGKEVDKVTMVDAEKSQVEISKVDATTKNELPGAELTIKDSEGKVVETWTSTSETHKVKLEAGKYTLTEVTAPQGYKIAESIEFEIDEEGNVVGSEDNKVTMTDEYSDQTVEISKTDVGGNEIADAQLTVTDENNNEVASWTSEAGKSHKITVQPGTYTLTETTAPNGYEKAESITFTVDKDGKVTVNGKEVEKVTMEDKYSDQKVKISKTDIAGEEIEGAELTVTDKDGKEVESWTSEAGKTHEVTLQPGTYTLTETTAPNGYEKAEAITFTVDKDGKVTVNGKEVEKVTMEDKYSDQKVKISKTDIAGEEIEGAELTVTDKDGKEVESWTSEAGKTHEVTLQPGTYTLTETTAPKGYKKAESITFTVDKDGKVTVGEDTVEKVVMVDTEKNQVEISKVDATTKNELPGAELTIKDSEGKVVETWTSTSETHKVKLEAGKYTLTEVTAPQGYKIAESIEFEIDEEGNVVGSEDNKVTMEDEYSDQTVEISKTDVGGTEIEGAQLTVTDKDGKEVESWTSEAGKSHKITVQPGTYTLTETTAPNGYEKAESITFSVDKDGKVTVNGTEVEKVTMEDKYSDQTVEISKTDVGGTEIEGAQLTVTDKDGKEVESWTSEAGKSHKITVQPGTYTLTETTAPNGYEKAEAITFTVDKDGKVTVNGTEVEKVTMEDKYSDQTVEISKTDVGGTEIEGAKLTVTDKDGKEVESWTSEAGKNHSITVQPGTYTLTEKTAPNGYEKAESITFTVDKDGNVKVNGEKVDKVTMTDEYSDHDVNISKVDATTKNELPGAQLKVTDKDGKEVDSWTSTNEKHVVSLKPGTYTLTETTAPDGYEVSESITFTVDINGNVSDEGNTVTMEDASEKVDITGTKTWEDNDNQDGVRPESITINLLANGEVVDTKTVTAADNWTYSFEGLNKMKDGAEIVYTITEESVSNYSSEVKGYDVTNTHTPGKTSVTVTKAWSDDNDQDGLRTKIVTVHLLANGKDTGKTVTLSAKNNWSASFTELDEKESGKVVEYTVKEDVPEGYKSEVTGDATSGFVITNTHESETTEYTVKKVWNDNNNASKTRPDSIQVQLYANGEAYGNVVEVTAKGNWTYTWKDLAKNESGKEIKYTVKEVSKVKNYTSSVDGSTITNTLNTTKTTTSTSGSNGTKTGLNTNAGLYGITIVAAGAAMVELMKKRK